MIADKIQTANEYIEAHKDNINKEFRNHYHLSAPIGWINDPNGFVYYQGAYHLFYQYYPYGSEWGPMHWGHAKSIDLVHWEHLPVALAPSEDYDIDGCFSGSAIVKDDKLYLMYTGHVENEEIKRETQCVAVSKDGIHFEKFSANPVLSEADICGVAAIEDFRDPKVFERGGVYYSVVASKTADERGQILLFESADLFAWRFKSVLLEGTKEQGIMWECPDLFELDGVDVCIMSPIQIQPKGHEYHNTSSTVAFLGKVDWEVGKMSVENFHEIDFGMDFYAPQTCLDEKGRRIMVAWMQMWHRTIVPHELDHGWSGSMSLPRELKVKDMRLIQKPIAEIGQFVQYDLAVEQTVLPSEGLLLKDICGDQDYYHFVFDLREADSLKLAFAKGEDDYLAIQYNVSEAVLTFDRSHCGYEIKGSEAKQLVRRTAEVPLINGQLVLEIYRDTSSLEIFANGRVTMTNTFYEKTKGRDIVLTGDGKAVLRSLEKGKII